MVDRASLPALPPLPLPAMPKDNESCSGKPVCDFFLLLSLPFPSPFAFASPGCLPPLPAAIADTVVDAVFYAVTLPRLCCIVAIVAVAAVASICCS